MSARARLAVLASGRGSNLESLIAACREDGFPAEIVLVLSDNAQARALTVAAEAGIDARAIDRRSFADRNAFEAALHDALLAANVEHICLAGFMRILSGPFVDKWQGRILNIHPSLLPAFKGLDTHARALQAGVRVHGASVHLVTAALDDGPILAQAAVAVRDDDTPQSLAARVLAAEHALYPHALRLHLGAGPAPPHAEPPPLFSPPLPPQG